MMTATTSGLTMLEELMVSSPAPANPPRKGALVEGTVLEVGKSGAVIDLCGKADAIVPPREVGFGLQVGDRVAFVVVSEPDDSDGVKLSRRLAQLWQELDWAHYLGETVTVQVTGIARKHGAVAGVRVKYKKKGVAGFIPASLLGQSMHRAKEEDVVGRDLKVKVRGVEIGDRLIFDHRQIEQNEVAETLTAGEELAGVVKSVATTADGEEFGLFVDIGGASGLVHRSEIPASPEPLSQRFAEGQPLDVVVLGVKEGRAGRKAISLSVKKLMQKRVLQALQPGQVLTVTVSKEAPYGYLVHLTDDGAVMGLIHRSQLGWAARTGKRKVAVGETVRARVDSIDMNGLRVSLSMRDVAQDETA